MIKTIELKQSNNKSDFCEEEKKVQYVDFIAALRHMKNGNGCMCEGFYFDKDSEFTIKEIDSNKWKLL